MVQSDEYKYMRRAIFLAERAEGSAVSPNPRVGAVLVHNGRVISEGYHQRAGAAHAEVDCLCRLNPSQGYLLKEATIYVTLEPCAHEGRTPSCAKRLAKEGIGRVVIGTLDPNPLVSGKGVAILRDAGVEVTVGVLEEECRWLARVFLTNQELGRPYILLKWAESVDGFMDHVRQTPLDPPAKLSTPFTQLLVHRLRSQYSAILVGSRTRIWDRPLLNNRLWLPSPYTPTPLLLSQHKPDDLPPHWSHLDAITTERLQELLQRGITSLIVEGGAATIESFLALGFWDEIRQEISPEMLRRGVKAPSIPEVASLRSTCSFAKNLIHSYTKESETH